MNPNRGEKKWLKFKVGLYNLSWKFGWIFLPLFLYGCQIEDIVIKVVQKEGKIEFFFTDKNDPSEVIEVHTLRVTGITVGGIFWELNTFDPFEWYEERNGRLVLKNKDIIPQINSIPLSHVKLGNVPEGFQQIFPSDGKSPILIKGNRYIISAYGGAHRGYTKFLIE